MSKVARVLGFVIMMDGLFSVVFGHAFIRWLKANFPSQLHGLFGLFERVPQPLFRAGAAFQAASGAHLLYHGGIARKK